MATNGETIRLVESPVKGSFISQRRAGAEIQETVLMIIARAKRVSLWPSSWATVLRETAIRHDRPDNVNRPFANAS